MTGYVYNIYLTHKATTGGEDVGLTDQRRLLQYTHSDVSKEDTYRTVFYISQYLKHLHLPFCLPFIFINVAIGVLEGADK